MGQQQRTVERDRELWRLRVSGRSVEWLAGHFGLSVRRVHEIIARQRGQVVDGTADELRAELREQLDHVRAEAAAIVDAPAPPAFSARGEQLWQRDEHGEPVAPVLDHSGRLAAIGAVVSVQARTAKLLGLDSPEQISITHELGGELAGLVAQAVSAIIERLALTPEQARAAAEVAPAELRRLALVVGEGGSTGGGR